MASKDIEEGKEALDSSEQILLNYGGDIEKYRSLNKLPTSSDHGAGALGSIKTKKKSAAIK